MENVLHHFEVAEVLIRRLANPKVLVFVLSACRKEA
jgi:hypothetical protein